MNEQTLTLKEQAQNVFNTTLGSMRKPRGKLKFINADMQTQMVTAFVEEVGYKEASARKVFGQLKKGAVEEGVITAEAPVEAPVEDKGPKKIDLARGLLTGSITLLNTTDISARDWRQKMIDGIMETCDVDRATAAANYNTCKKELEEAGLIDASRLGRGGQPVDDSHTWGRYNEHGHLLGTHGTRKAAGENLVGSQSVEKVAPAKAAKAKAA